MLRLLGPLFLVVHISCGLFAAPARLCLQDQKIPSMGTFFEIQIVNDCKKPLSKDLFLKIKDSLDRLESEMSLYQSQSPISKLNSDGILQAAPTDMLAVLKKSQQACEDTAGAFDISVLPVLELIKKSFKETKMPPTDQQLASLRPLVDCKKIQIQGNKVQLQKGQKITLDGIAKGFAVDRVSEELNKQGVKNYLLNFSGNMRWQGHKADKSTWKIYAWNAALQKADPLIPLKNGSVASSGAEFNYYSDDKKWHHIIDPQSLHPSQVWASTTVFGPDATICDVLSTATYSLNTQQIQILLKNHYPDYQVWATQADGKMQLISAKMK